ncbi:MAG: hypothetical protein KGL46_02610 [Hyphomicrobiales bacterium]|nr:hypothetical protein [Hyphomicrobiales bacterium]
MRFLATALLCFVAFAARAASIDSCESIKDADAYNRCLASFGPVAHPHAPTTPEPAAEKAADQATAASASKAGDAVARRAGGKRRRWGVRRRGRVRSIYRLGPRPHGSRN